MREIIARAMAESDNAARIDKPVGQRFYRFADAVLAAMREPTPPVIEGLAVGWLGAGGDKDRDYAPEALAAWRGAIDAAKDGA